MIFKIIALIAVAIPIFLFVRSVFFQRTTRVNEGLREFKKQANLAVSIFLDVVVVTLNASAAYRGRDGSKDQIEEDAARRVLQCMSLLGH
jgi:hypothetical protein